jgi:hypothetical protein
VGGAGRLKAGVGRGSRRRAGQIDSAAASASQAASVRAGFCEAGGVLRGRRRGAGQVGVAATHGPGQVDPAAASCEAAGEEPGQVPAAASFPRRRPARSTEQGDDAMY